MGTCAPMVRDAVQSAEESLEKAIESEAPAGEITKAQRRLDEARAKQATRERHEAERAKLAGDIQRRRELAKQLAALAKAKDVEASMRQALGSPTVTLSYDRLRVTILPEASGDSAVRLAARFAPVVALREIVGHFERAVGAARASALGKTALGVPTLESLRDNIADQLRASVKAGVVTVSVGRKRTQSHG